MNKIYKIYPINNFLLFPLKKYVTIINGIRLVPPSTNNAQGIKRIDNIITPILLFPLHLLLYSNRFIIVSPRANVANMLLDTLISLDIKFFHIFSLY